MFTFLRPFSDIPIVEFAANNSEFLELIYFFANKSENHKIFRVVPLEKMTGRGMPNILLFNLYREG